MIENSPNDREFLESLKRTATALEKIENHLEALVKEVQTLEPVLDVEPIDEK